MGCLVLAGGGALGARWGFVGARVGMPEVTDGTRIGRAMVVPLNTVGIETRRI